jgi:signal transduction histidine kinase
MIILSFYLYQGVLKSAEEIIEDNKNITQTAVKKLTEQSATYVQPIWKEHLANKNKITKQEERDIDTLLSVSVQQVLTNFHRLEGGYYFSGLDEFLGYSFPTISDPKPAFGPPPRSYNIIREQARQTIQRDTLLTELHQFDPAIFPLSTQPIYVDGEIIAVAWARTHIERKLSTSQTIQSGTFFLTVGAILVGLFITVLTVWTLRSRMKEIKEGLSEMKYEPDRRLKEYNGAFGVISRSINEMMNTQQKEQDKARKLQSELHQKDKMASLGNLIAGTAHEINTPISIIKTRIQMWERALKKSQKLNSSSTIVTVDSLSIIQDEIERVSSLIKKLLFFSKPLKNEKTYVNIHDLLLLNIKRVEQAYPGYNFYIETDFDNKIPKIFADEEAIDHVLINILKNSVEASPEDCNLLIKTTLVKSEGNLLIKIRDFGTGISNEIKNRIFEPFFSKKVNGTGLGLSICNEIITAHNGKIEFSTPEKISETMTALDQTVFINSSTGTVTTITLPLHSDN